MKRKQKKKKVVRRLPRRSLQKRKKAASPKRNNRKNSKQKRKVQKKVMTQNATSVRQLPIPQHFDPKAVGTVRRVDYAAIEEAALKWRRLHGLQVASQDDRVVTLLIVDAQNTFCIPGFELYVAGRSGTGAIDDNRRLCEFVYRNLGIITSIAPTMDTHKAMQIFHRIFFVNAKGEHPIPIIQPVTAASLRSGEWMVNPEIAWSISNDKSKAGVGRTYNWLKRHALYYCETLEKNGKLPFTVWPYHAMLSGIGHALVAAVEEACFFHNIARASQTCIEIKGGNPTTENYSILRPEVLIGADNNAIAQKNAKFIRTLLDSDRVIIAGQAKSHCVAWTIADLLSEIKDKDPELAKKVYILEDCTSAVTVPDGKGGFVVDFTDQADASFKQFAAEGMHLVKSTDPVDSWDGFMD